MAERPLTKNQREALTESIQQEKRGVSDVIDVAGELRCQSKDPEIARSALEAMITGIGEEQLLIGIILGMKIQAGEVPPEIKLTKGVKRFELPEPAEPEDAEVSLADEYIKGIRGAESFALSDYAAKPFRLQSAIIRAYKSGLLFGLNRASSLLRDPQRPEGKRPLKEIFESLGLWM